ncbi:MAG TPA: CopG family transcriptional regulator [Chthoniobacterales bacterium]|nr:CopG family transcriptional regulator [Chthoniobacterales bacterium]
MKTKPATHPLPIRLDAELRARIKRAAKRMGASDSATIRFAIVNQLPHIEAGRITLSPAAK